MGAFSYKRLSRHTLFYMLRLTRGETENIVVTLTEKTSIENPYYLFVFTHTTEKAVVKFIKSSATDLSGYTERFNEFQVPSSVFQNSPVGQWLYQVYEQSSAVNLDPTGLTEVENGRMDLQGTEIERVGYTPTVNISSYNG